MFGVLELVSKHPELNLYLKNAIKGMISGNTLGPIAFVTPGFVTPYFVTPCFVTPCFVTPWNLEALKRGAGIESKIKG